MMGRRILAGGAEADSLIDVRPERLSDYEKVYAVQQAAFDRPNEARLVEALRASVGMQLSLVAERAGQVVGHVFFSSVEIEPRQPSPPVGGLAPVGVLPEWQGRGIGSALIRGGLEGCAALGWRAVVLVGNPQYYARFGFVLAAPRGLRYESEAFDSAFQLLELTPGALAGCRGWVRYPKAFSETGTTGP